MKWDGTLNNNNNKNQMMLVKLTNSVYKLDAKSLRNEKGQSNTTNVLQRMSDLYLTHTLKYLIAEWLLIFELFT